MGRRERGENNILEGVIWKELLIFFFPIMLGTLFQQMYNTVDSVVVGKFVGKEALASVGGSSAHILNLIIGFFVGLSSGATVIVSQFYGAKDPDGVSRAVHTAFSIAIVGGAIMTALGLLAAPMLLHWMNTPAEILDQSTLYLRVIFLFMIPSSIYNIGSGIFRAIGDSRRPLYFLIVCCVINIVLDLVFVLGLGMGVAGVAIATGIAQTISAALICFAMMRSRDSYRLVPAKIRPDGELLARTVRIGLPTGISSTMYSLSNMIITTAVNGFGTATVAAWVALGKVDGMFWLIVSAFGVSIMTFVGQNYGACLYDRVRRSLKVCMGIALGASWVFSGLMVLFSRHVFQLFTTDAEVLSITIRLMLYMAPCYWLYVPIEIIGGTLRGMGRTLIPTIITAIGICAMRVIWMFGVVPHWRELLAITLNYPISWILTSVVFVIYYNIVSKSLLPKKPE